MSSSGYVMPGRTLATDTSYGLVRPDCMTLHTYNGIIFVRLTRNPPATSSDNGTQGDIAIDSNYIYVCVATNTWKRTALSTW